MRLLQKASLIQVGIQVDFPLKDLGRLVPGHEIRDAADYGISLFSNAIQWKFNFCQPLSAHSSNFRVPFHSAIAFIDLSRVLCGISMILFNKKFVERRKRDLRLGIHRWDAEKDETGIIIDG